MKIEEYKENEDGSATLVIDLTDEEVRLLVETSITEALEVYIKKYEARSGDVVKRSDLPRNSFEV